MEVIRKVIAFTAVSILLIGGGITLLFILDKPDVDTYERTRMDVSITVSLENVGTAPAMDIPLRLALPQNISGHQEVIGIAISPSPSRTSSDMLENRFVHFTIDVLQPLERMNITVNVSLLLTSTDYHFHDSGELTMEGDMSMFLVESALIDFRDPLIISTASKIAGDTHVLTDIAWETYIWIIENIRYQQVAGELDAATTLRRGEGGSAEFANLFVALLRANGIPSRRVSGWGTHFNEGDVLKISSFSHGWAEFYVPDYGWMQVDPTWGRTSRFDNFARTDAEHVVLTLGDGVHFLQRGPYSTPFGNTEVDTDYDLQINDISRDNLSMKRDLILYSIVLAPVTFIVFIVYQKISQRRL